MPAQYQHLYFHLVGFFSMHCFKQCLSLKKSSSRQIDLQLSGTTPPLNANLRWSITALTLNNES